jgi:hypothetical protein
MVVFIHYDQEEDMPDSDLVSQSICLRIQRAVFQRCPLRATRHLLWLRTPVAVFIKPLSGLARHPCSPRIGMRGYSNSIPSGLGVNST